MVCLFSCSCENVLLTVNQYVHCCSLSLTLKDDGFIEQVRDLGSKIHNKKKITATENLFLEKVI